MASNTKLTLEQKQHLKDLRKEQPKVFIGRSFSGDATVALRRTGHKMGVFAVSIASEDEKKIRPRVGEFQARLRLDWELGSPIKIDPDTTAGYMQDIADALASFMAAD